MALQFLEEAVFGSTTRTTPIDLDSLAQYIKPTITKLGIKVDADL